MENKNWKEGKSSELIDLISGFAFKSANFLSEKRENTLPIIKIKNVANGDVNLNDVVYHEYNDKLSNYVIEKGDVLIAMTGNHIHAQTQIVGDVSLCKLDEPVLLNQRVGKFVAKNDADLKFAYYLFKDEETRFNLANKASGSANQANVSKTDILDLDILIPPLPEQKAIASVLSSLDDKIDLLHQQNQTLEALAETLYLNFIGEREFNSKLSDIFSLQNGYAFKSKSFKESGIIRVIKIKNISGDIVDITNSDFVDDESIKKLDVKFKINSGDILIAMTGAEVGKLGIVPETDQSLWLNQRVGSIKQKFEGAKYLVYLHLKSDFGQDYIENTATGSAQPNISGEGIENCEFPLYEEAELEEICNKLSPLYDKVIFNLGQIQTLTKLRDTLLPKLMSGEVRVKCKSSAKSGHFIL